MTENKTISTFKQLKLAKGDDGKWCTVEAKSKFGTEIVPTGTRLVMLGTATKEERSTFQKGAHNLRCRLDDGREVLSHKNHLDGSTKYNEGTKDKSGWVSQGEPVEVAEDEELVALREQVAAAKKAKAEEQARKETEAAKEALRRELAELSK